MEFKRLIVKALAVVIVSMSVTACALFGLRNDICAAHHPEGSPEYQFCDVMVWAALIGGGIAIGNAIDGNDHPHMTPSEAISW